MNISFKSRRRKRSRLEGCRVATSAEAVQDPGRIIMARTRSGRTLAAPQAQPAAAPKNQHSDAMRKALSLIRRAWALARRAGRGGRLL
ncbi:hypothetical protein [Actinomyces faecalis]|uniref:hypothetical protein n=1 Tax=Actinomyces faecalis TaxID=2722820 RepID=UPI0015544C04|nr:hypothetical protein [Actinomyces faecalis]